MNAQLHSSDGRIRYRYPTPIATPFRLMRIAQSPVVRLGHALGTIDETVRFLCWILLCDYLGGASDTENDPEVEGLLRGLERPSTERLFRLLTRLAATITPAGAFVPELHEALLGDAGKRLAGLCEDAAQIAIERSALDSSAAESWTVALEPRIEAVLGDLHVLEGLLLARPSQVSPSDPSAWYLHPWRGAAASQREQARPILVLVAPGGQLSGMGTTLLFHPDRPVALRLDPFVVPGADGRVMGLLAAPELRRVRYEHYASGSWVEWDVPLGNVLGERSLRPWRVELGLDPASVARLHGETTGSAPSIPGYDTVISRAAEPDWDHFRAVRTEACEVHDVVAVHPHRVRDEIWFRRLLSSLETLGGIRHPNLAPPSVQEIDPGSGRFVVGTPHAVHGRLADRLPDGARLPVHWAVRCADALLAGLDALAERGVHLRSLPPWAVTFGREIRLVPFLLEADGRAADGPRLVGRLLCRMLAGEEPSEMVPPAAALGRAGVPEPIARITMAGIAGEYDSALQMRAELRSAATGLDAPASPMDGSKVIVERVFAHLQRLRPGALEGLEAALHGAGDAPDPAALAGAVDAVWDPDERLGWFVRLTEIAGESGELQGLVLRVLARLLAAAGDHLPTLKLAATSYGGSVPSGDRARLFERILHASATDEERAVALAALAGYSEEQRQIGRALELWQEYVALRPRDPDGWRGVCRAQRILGDQEALAAGLRKLLSRTAEPGERSEVVRELAALRAGPLGDPLGAVDLLREVAGGDGSGLGPWEILRDLARELHDDALLVEALEGLWRHPELSDRERFAVGLERAITVGFRGDDAHGAMAILDEVARLRPNDRALLSYRALILCRSGLWLEASHALEEWAGAEDDPACLGLALRRLARVTHQNLGEPERAVALYEGVLETDPTDREALAFLDEAYSRAEDHAHLAAVLASRVDVATVRDERLELLRRLASTYDEKLGDTVTALHTYGRLLFEDPRDAESLARYVDLADRTQSWAEAEEVVEVVLPHLPPDTAKDWRHRLGKMRLEHAEDLSAVVQLFREAVREDPGDIPSLEGLADATARIGAWEENVEATRSLAALAATDRKRVEHLHAAAETLRDRVLAPKRAAAAYEEILGIDGEDVLALRSLAALGEAAGRTPAERVAVLRRWVELCADPVDRLEALEDIVALAEHAGLEPAEAAAIWEDILELDPANPQALSGLLEHHRSRKEWQRAIDVLEQMIETAGSSDEPLLLQRMAETRADDMGDLAGAVETLERLISSYPEHPLDLDFLERVYLDAGKPRRLSDLLGERAQATPNEGRRADFLYRQARVHARRLADEPRALELAEQAVTQSPGHLEALELLAEAYVREEQWPPALRVLDLLVAAIEESGSATDDQAADAWIRLAEVREKVDDLGRAGEAFEQALVRRPSDPGAMLGLARVAWEAREHDLADVRYREVLEKHGDRLSAEKLAHVRAALGDIAAARGDDERSRELLEQALAARPDSADTLRELVAVCERQGDWEGVARFRRQVAAGIEDPLERFAELMELAEIFRKRLQRDDDARPLLEQAKELRPDSVAVPVQLLEVYLSTGRYKQAVDTLQSLIDREDNPKRRARYTYTLAMLYRDHLHEPRKAVAFLNETLDLDPGKLEAFEALDRILVKHKDWHGQAQSYRAMISRIEGRGKPDLEHSLYRNLAKILQTGLNEPEEAAKALEQALERNPRDVEVREQLARAQEDLDPAGEKALAEYRRILAVDPRHKGAWKSLGRVFARKRDRDGAWNVCGVLELLGLADEREKAFYAKHQKPALALRKGIDGIEHWERYLFDPRQDVSMGRIFELCAVALGPRIATRTPQELGLGPQDAVSLRQRSRFTGFLATVSKILRVPIPPVYRAAHVRGIHKEPMYPPAMIVGPEVITGRKGKELRFLIGKAMAFFLPPHLLAGMYPAGHMRTILLAAMSSVMPEWSQGGEPGVRGVQKQLEDGLAPHHVEEMRRLCLELTGRGLGPNVNEWQKQVERTANHAGHLLCNDIDVSVRMIQEERTLGHRWSKLSVQDAIADLALYTVGDRYLALRREVGAAIQESS